MKRAALLVLALHGCGTPAYMTQTQNLVASGQCNAARDTVLRGTTDAETRAAFWGSIYSDCDHNRQEAIRWFTLAARFGNPPSQQILARWGAPVPSPDLRNPPAPKGGTICTQVWADTTYCF